MKKTALIFLSFLFASMLLSAQDSKQRLDSIMAEAYDSQTGLLDYSDKIAYKYNNQNRLSQYTYYFKEGSGLWEDVEREDYSYDISGNLIHFKGFTYSGVLEQFVLSSLTEYSYDNDGNQVQMVISNWEFFAQTWITALKSEFTYDGSGNMTSQIDYAQNEAGTDWILENKSEYLFDENGNTTQYLNYYWDNDAGSWTESWRQDFTYNGDGHLTELIGFLWDNSLSSWDAWDKSTYNYDDNGNLISQYSFDKDGLSDEWTEAYKFEYSYDTYGNLIEEIMYASSIEEGEWDPMKKDIYSFDINYSYADLIVSGIFAEFFSVLPNMLIGANFYDWDDTDNVWKEESILFFYFSEVSTSGIKDNLIPDIKIFPNPTHDFININLDNTPGQAYFILYDMNGRKISSDRLHNSHTQIPVKQLKSGVYQYQLIRGGKVQKGRIMVR